MFIRRNIFVRKKEQEHLIQTVYPGSIAEELEIEPGDVLLKINGQKIEDVFDYRYLMKDEYVEVLIRKPSGEEWLLEIDKEYDDELGVEFENGLMSEYRSCSNKCMFCFIDQMPPGMRETLYFKDDDSRLSFLQGNYITMTNMKQADIDRIIHMQLAPINISVQTTNPELRCKMLHNRFAGEKLKFLQDLYEAHIEMNGQIVLCKGVNDKDELKRSIEDLSSYLPFMRSVSVVPAGLTKYREGLYPLELFSKEEAGEVIDMIESYQPKFYEEYGLHFIQASDEWYILAERDFPEEERYDGFYAVCTNLSDMSVDEIIKINKKRWEIEECFRIMKTDFKARPVYLQTEDHIRSHFLTCFIALMIYRILEKKLKEAFTCEEIIDTLRNMWMARPGEKLGYTPVYTRTDLTDALHETAGFRTDYQIITDVNMRKIIRATKKKK